jgi:hypothetical protein
MSDMFTAAQVAALSEEHHRTVDVLRAELQREHDARLRQGERMSYRTLEIRDLLAAVGDERRWAAGTPEHAEARASLYELADRLKAQAA